MQIHLTERDVDTLLTSLKFGKLRIEECKYHQNEESRRLSLQPLIDVESKLKQAKRKASK